MTREEVKAEIRSRLDERGSVVVAIEGMCGAGKSTFAEELAREFDARLFRADDYFLRPEQRTPQRLSEVGGNFDRERFFEEVAEPARQRRDAICRRYFCSTGTLSDSFSVPFTPVTVVEGSYCMHPGLGEYFDIGIFLQVSSDEQSRRIMRRNGPQMHKRFINEWIPMENSYFQEMGIKSKCRFLL